MRGCTSKLGLDNINETDNRSGIVGIAGPVDNEPIVPDKYAFVVTPFI